MDSRGKILIIDDSRTVLAWATSILKGAGFDVTTRDQPIGTGAEVVRVRPDLVLVDIKMPTLEGDEVTALIRKSAAKDTAVVLHSSLPVPELQSRVCACGANGFIQKTANAGDFVRQVERHLHATQLARVQRSPVPPQQLSVKLSRGVTAQAADGADGSLAALVGLSPSARPLATLVLNEFPDIGVETAAGDDEVAALITAGKPYAFVVLQPAPGQEVEALKSLAAVRARGSRIPVIVFTTGCTGDAVRRANRAGVTHCLEKPVAAHVFRMTIREILSCPDITPSGSQARRAPRLRVPVPVTYKNGRVTEATTWDVNEYGAFLCTEDLRPIGDKARMILHLPQGGRDVDIACSVVHVRHEAVDFFPRGFAVSFDIASAQERRGIEAAFRLV